MLCLRCGHCCIHYAVVVVDDPAKGIAEDNLICREGGAKCKHLVGDTPGKYSCAIHNEQWYPETPCYRHGQIERSSEESCRIGKWILENKPADTTSAGT